MMHRTSTLPQRVLALLLLPLLVASALVARPAHPAFAVIEGATEVTPVAPGTTLTTFVRMTDHGPVRGALLSIDLRNLLTSIRLLTPGPLAAAEPLSQMAARSGAVAAVNGDFFDQYHTNAPYGSAIADGQLLKGPIFSRPSSSPDRIYFWLHLGTVMVRDMTQQLPVKIAGLGLTF